MRRVRRYLSSRTMIRLSASSTENPMDDYCTIELWKRHTEIFVDLTAHFLKATILPGGTQ